MAYTYFQIKCYFQWDDRWRTGEREITGKETWRGQVARRRPERMGTVKAEIQLWRVCLSLSGPCVGPQDIPRPPSLVTQIKPAQRLNSKKLNMRMTKVSEPSLFLLGSGGRMGPDFPSPATHELQDMGSPE